LPTNAVFLSYASQDAEAARRICEALRGAGVEVWFDQSELRGGEAWDVSIRRQIKSCRLFLPIISVNTQAREEGYFRREWNLAVSRTLDMAEDTAFLLPVVIDSTHDADARVPERFRAVQWTRLPGGETPASFVERVRGLLSKNTEQLSAPVGISPQPTVIMDASRGEKRRAPVHPKPGRSRGFRFLVFASPVLLLAVAASILIPPWLQKERARNDLLPAIQDVAGKMFRSNRKIFDMAMTAEKYLPNDPTLAKLWPSIATTMSIETEPAGAEVYWKDYDTPAAEWRFSGVSPLKEVKVPRDYLRLEIRKAGYQTIELAMPSFSVAIRPIVQHLKLDPLGSLPENMVRIPKSTTEMYIVGLEKSGPKEVSEFLIDKFEVTNKQFKAFIDAGGYTNPAYWNFPIVEAGKTIPLATALAKFMDRTGRQGPATWEAGSYLDGTENHPVTGVSWYEAAAYAAYVHKQLPTVFHWAAVADTTRSEFLLPLSNFNGKSTSAVGSLAGLSTYGVYDLAGNAREWTFNQTGDSDQRFILGGGWTDPSYAFNDSFSQPAMDRSESNGFRCIKELADVPSLRALMQPLSREFRDYSKEKPVSDATFASFSRQFVYDKTPLRATVEKTMESEAWKADVVSIDAGYNNDRLVLYVFLPKTYSAPLQPVVFFSGSNGIHESKFDPTLINSRLLFIMKSGRALIFPIYKGTYERQDDLKSDLQEETVRYKDHVIMWGKEYSRTVDYLETRKDMQADKVAYLGISWGGFMGGIIPAVEKRIKVVVLNVGGMAMEKALPEADQINYLPRVTQPVLMLNGKYDMFFPVETAQKPMFRLLGTAENHKKMVVYDAGHLVPQTEFIKETLSWFDTYLGPAH
jgi:formylglycine-generating enzyme required for sulfatase activity/pimeloyl-ACP methyl ester carboxylesterase